MHCSCSSRFGKLGFFLGLMNSSPSSLMGYCTLAIEFLRLKNYTSYYYINSFSLLRIFFLSHSLRFSHNPNTKHKTQNTKQNPILKIKLNQNKQIWKKKKKGIKQKRTSRSDPVSHIIQTQNTKQILILIK